MATLGAVSEYKGNFARLTNRVDGTLGIFGAGPADSESPVDFGGAYPAKGARVYCFGAPTGK